MSTEQFLSDSSANNKNTKAAGPSNIPIGGNINKHRAGSKSSGKYSQMLNEHLECSRLSDAEIRNQKENEEFKKKVAKKGSPDPMAYFYTYSSSYYQKSQIKFDREVRKFESRLAESLSDYQKHWSDVKFSDGYNSGRGRVSAQEHKLGQNNYRFERNGY